MEFSLIVLDDSYNPNDLQNITSSRVNLELNKIMGLSVAYNDDDTPSDDRDNMIGSVINPPGEENDS